MGKHIDLGGKRFGRLTVTEEFFVDKHGRRRWKCFCECGKSVYVTTNNLTSGHTKSCGCWNKEVKAKTHTKHGMSQSRIYSIWSNMKARCECETNDAYHLYGGRGIKVCDEWRDFNNFAKWARENGYRKDLTIDRIDNDGDYCPDNCRWATAKEQGNNTRTCKMITYNGETKTMRGWEEKMGLSKGVIHWRLNHGWSEKEAIETKRRGRAGRREKWIKPAPPVVGLTQTHWSATATTAACI